MGTFKPVEKLLIRAVSDEILAPYLAQVDRYDGEFIQNKLTSYSNAIKSVILYKAFKHESAFERNTYIRKTTDDLFSLLPKKLAHMFFASDDDIQLMAKACAEYARQIIINPESEQFLSVHYENPVNVNGISTTGKTVNGNKQVLKTVNGMNINERNSVYGFVARYVLMFKITPPEPDKRIPLTGCLKRMADNRWWCRKFRKLITQANEKSAIYLNLVNRKKQIYASNRTTKNRISQLARNEQLLSSHFIINQAGQRYSLKEISDLNVSNPEVRKAELINRVRACEEISKIENDEGLFITITCPSKYHRAFSKSGSENPKWGGYMPDDAQKYLCNVWTRIRAELNRKGINIYGFRVVEPQHDGTPHWHCLLYTRPEHIQAFQRIVSSYSLLEDGDEKGALENRCDFKKVDPNKNATGYIMKYIVKNIDGKGLGKDKFGNDAVSTATRINAWASCWCIRQFQQIGGASVTIWRELRRIKQSFFADSIFEKARIAADNSDWQAYINVMGGIHAPRNQHPIKLHYDMNVNEDTGECQLSYYDSEIVMKIKGLLFEGQKIITRLHQWQIAQ
jgi:hypothetical protein